MKEHKRVSPVRRWVIMTCLCLSGGFIYLMPYMRQVYHIPLLDALDITNTQLGAMASVFGVTAMICYFPGGWLADRFSARSLITFSMLATGLSGLYFATFPSFSVSVGLHAFWGVTSILTFWSALIKATRNWAPQRQQGRAFGILEGGRGIAELAASTALLAVFARLGSGQVGLSWVIIGYSILNVLVGVMAWFYLEDSVREDAEPDRQVIGLKQVVSVLRMPAVWLVAVVVVAGYSAYLGSFYFAPFATDAFLMSVVFGGAIGVSRMWVRPVAAIGAGFLADRVGISTTVAWFFGIVIVSFSVFALTPGNPGLLTLLIVNTVLAALAAFALRGLYYALLEEGGIPLAVTGTAAGVVSVLGYTPDAFMPILGGILLDKYPDNLGYRIIFGFVAILGVIGLVAAMAIRRRKREGRQPHVEQTYRD